VEVPWHSLTRQQLLQVMQAVLVYLVDLECCLLNSSSRLEEEWTHPVSCPPTLMYRYVSSIFHVCHLVFIGTVWMYFGSEFPGLLC